MSEEVYTVTKKGTTIYKRHYHARCQETGAVLMMPYLCAQPENAAVKGIAVIGPALGIPGILYASILEFFVKQGYQAVVPAWRGQGENKVGRLPAPHDQKPFRKVDYYADDLRALLDHESFLFHKRYGFQAPLFFFGNSIGALSELGFFVKYRGAFKGRIQGAFLVSPTLNTVSWRAFKGFPVPVRQIMNGRVATITSVILSQMLGEDTYAFDQSDYKDGYVNPALDASNGLKQVYDERPDFRKGGITYGWIKSVNRMNTSVCRYLEKYRLSFPLVVCAGKQDKVVDHDILSRQIAEINARYDVDHITFHSLEGGHNLMEHPKSGLKILKALKAFVRNSEHGVHSTAFVHAGNNYAEMAQVRSVAV